MTESNPDTLWQQAQLAFRTDPARAAAACERLLAIAPDFWGAHWMLSRLLQAQGRMRAAVAHARASARGLRANATPHELLTVSSGLVSVGEYETCTRLLAALDARGGMDARQVVGVVQQYMMLDDPASALQWIDAARAAGLHDSMLAFLRGNACVFVGRKDDALSAFEDALRMDPSNAAAHFALASLDVEDGRPTRIERIERALASAPNDEMRSALHYAAFKELDRAGDTVRAWPHLAQGMAMRKAMSRYDAAREDAIFDRILDAARDVEPARADNVDDARMPLFIIGLPRSGTTVVERILGNHRDVANCGELNELRMAYKWASDHYCEGFLDLEAADRLATTDAAIVGERYMDATRWRTGAHRVQTDKHPGNLALAGVALRGVPRAKIVHVHKDPMDACFGVLRELFTNAFHDYSYAFDDVANHHRNYTRLMRHLRERAPTRVVDVRYESLVRDPAGEADALLAACGLSAQAGVQDITANRTPVTTASSAQVRMPIHAGRVGYWQRYERELAPLRDALE